MSFHPPHQQNHYQPNPDKYQDNNQATTETTYLESQPNIFDNKVLDVDELEGGDITRLNPTVYIHNAIIKAQEALVKEDVKAGFLQYWVLINNAEVLCKASNLIPEGYENDLKEFKESEEYKSSPDDLTRHVKLATKKLELLMGEISKSKVSTMPLKL